MSADPIRLDGRAALVCGAGGDIGQAIVRVLADRGARVLAADIQEQAAVPSTGAARNRAALAFRADVRHEADVRLMIEEAASRFGGLDLVINNAALQTPDQSRADGDVEHMSPAAWDDAFAVNARGTMLVCKHALPVLARRGGGAIVNLASNLGLQGGLRQAAYAASKAAVMQLTRSIAASHGKFAIRCNAVAPGLTLTEKVRTRVPAAVLEAVEAETLLPSLAAPADIAQAVAFLGSDAARHITGQTLVVDGGTASHVPGLAALRQASTPR